MPTYIQDLDYTVHAIKSVSHQLKVIEEPDIPNCSSKLTISIVRNNSSDISKGGREKLTIKINDETVYDAVATTPAPTPYGSDEVFIQTRTVPHTSETNNFTVSVTYKCDIVDTIGNTYIGNLTPDIYYTVGTATITGTCTPIDQSPPEISGLSVTADRYGLNASASFTAKHSSYDLTLIEFKLSGMTRNQAIHRYNTHKNHKEQGTFTNNQSYGSKDGIYWFSVRLVYPIGQSKSVNFDLDDRPCDPPYSLDSGGSYPWELTVTAYNGKTTTVSGTLKVPQKVTGVTCEPQLDLVPGQTVELDYTVFPGNAELQTVKFTSSDSEIAEVSDEGIITAKNEGPCILTVKTEDGGFTATCNVYVLDTETFPRLEPVERYFTARHLTKMILATQFIKLQIEDLAGSVADFEVIYFSGRAEKVINIFPILKTFTQNCNRLKIAAGECGVSVVNLPEVEEITKNNFGWIRIINGWISFLNELHEKLTEV